MRLFMQDESLRGRLENRVIETSWKVEVSQTDIAWVDSDEFQAFLKAWGELVNYYTQHPDDTVIGVEVLREYLDFTRLLRKILLSSHPNDEQREKIEDTITSIENLLSDIITAVVSYNDSTRYNLAP